MTDNNKTALIDKSVKQRHDDRKSLKNKENMNIKDMKKKNDVIKN